MWAGPDADHPFTFSWKAFRMALLTSAGSGSSILSPEQVMQLVVQPLLDTAVATRVSTIVQTMSHDARFPIVVTDPTTAFTAEGEEITPSDSDHTPHVIHG